MTRKQIVKILERERKKIADARDELRELYDEIGDQIDSCDNGLQNLEAAIDCLSELV